MIPGTLRELKNEMTFGECYLCRRIYLLQDLRPVDSPNADDWRYICHQCASVAKRKKVERR